VDGFDEPTWNDRHPGSVPPLFAIGRDFLRFLQWTQFEKIELSGPRIPEKKGGYVIANHFGRVGDPALLQFLFGSRQDIKIVAWNGIGEGFWVEQAQIILIPNQFEGGSLKGVRETYRRLNELAEYVAQGGVVLIFPEGACSGQRYLKQFQEGIAQLVMTTLQKGANPWIYVAAISYERFLYPRNQSIILRSELYSVGPEMKDLYASSKSQAKAELTQALQERVASMTILSEHPALVVLEDGIGALLRGRHPNVDKRMATVVRECSSVASQLPDDTVQQITDRVRSYLSEADELRIPFGSELIPPEDPRSVRILLELAFLAPVVYFGFFLHGIPLSWAEDRVRSGRTELQWQIEQMLFGWGAAFGRWYRNVFLGTYVMLAFGLFPVAGIWSFADAIPASLIATLLYFGLGLLTVKQYRRINLARLWAFPTKRFAAHVSSAQALYSEIISLRE